MELTPASTLICNPDISEFPDLMSFTHTEFNSQIFPSFLNKVIYPNAVGLRVSETVGDAISHIVAFNFGFNFKGSFFWQWLYVFVEAMAHLYTLSFKFRNRFSTFNRLNIRLISHKQCISSNKYCVIAFFVIKVVFLNSQNT
ncbi:hypothetical protein [Algibacter sp. L4_22]|uniref:hypothetical protein n=1 Tax=Algibacter sp. L4_22 TaxID=2942477 RepID=UPI00201B8B28|nr:hypothetical protein [Algibacter sp. L4_22]MCL5129868.1 hypothetical protein [Algibacter sp. L4_22]